MLRKDFSLRGVYALHLQSFLSGQRNLIASRTDITMKKALYSKITFLAEIRTTDLKDRKQERYFKSTEKVKKNGGLMTKGLRQTLKLLLLLFIRG